MNVVGVVGQHRLHGHPLRGEVLLPYVLPPFAAAFDCKLASTFRDFRNFIPFDSRAGSTTGLIRDVGFTPKGYLLSVECLRPGSAQDLRSPHQAEAWVDD